MKYQMHGGPLDGQVVDIEDEVYPGYIRVFARPLDFKIWRPECDLMAPPKRMRYLFDGRQFNYINEASR